MRKFALGAAVLALVVIIFAAVACQEAEPLLQVKILEQDTETVRYQVVYDNGKVGDTDEFVSDTQTLLYAKYGDFQSSVGYRGVENRLISTQLEDAAGNEAEGNAVIDEMMQKSAETIKHDIMEYIIIQNQGNYFAFVGLNVNLHSPYLLYQYDTETKELKELYQWENIHLLGTGNFRKFPVPKRSFPCD